jgi:hypothetical protein
MRLDTTLDTDRWLRQQSGVIHDVFERAAEELQSSGIRLLVGSVQPALEDMDQCKSITIVPLRFSGSNDDEALSLSLLATTRRGPPRYMVVLAVSGILTVRALRNLATEHADIWKKAYLKNGLWISDGENTHALCDLSQIIQNAGTSLRITGVFLHSDLSRTIQQGVMVIGILYRSILDELSEAGKMGRLYAQLSNSLDNSIPRFQRIVRP